MRNFGISKKLFLAFGLIVAISVAAAQMNHVLFKGVSDHGIEAGEKLAPLGDAAMEIKLTATHAHLLFEEIMSGDGGESIDEVWKLLEETQFYVNAIINGGSNDEGVFHATKNAQVREKIGEVQVSVNAFIEAAKKRYALLGDGQGVGSPADEEFDGLYDNLIERIDSLAQPAAFSAAVQKASGDARYHLAHGHLLVAEILGGDEGEDFGEATGSFEAAGKALMSITDAQVDASARDAILADIGRLITLAETRYASSKNTAGAGSAEDEAFDQTFESFIALADEAEELIHDDMDAAISQLYSEGTFANWAQLLSAMLILGVAVGSGIFLSRNLAGRAVQLSAVACDLAAGNTSVELPNWASRDELGQMKESLETFRDSLIEQQALQEKVRVQDQRQEADRKRLLAELAEEFKASTETCFSALENASGGLQSAIDVMADAVQNSTTMVGATTDAAGGASANVGTVAAAAEELSASIGEISRQVMTTAEVVDTATSRASATSEKISNLAEAVEKIGQVVTLIQEIAEQTNLLALNATIEAARAGEMGRGFAVVASEVKELANQTAKATDEIGGHIAAIQESTRDAVHAIHEITGTMSEIEANTSSISSAVEQQGSATQEIASNAQATSVQTDQVSKNMSSMGAAVGTVSETATQVRQSSIDIAASTADLRKSMADFLARLNAA